MLNEIYENWRNRGAEIGLLGEAFFAPILVQPPVDWTTSKHRVAFIGQETMGWLWTRANAIEYGYGKWEFVDVTSLADFINNPASLNALLEGYRRFDFAAHQPGNYNGLFFRYFRKCKKLIADTEGTTVSVLFSNLIRCAVDADAGFTLWSLPESDRLRYLQWQRGLLRAELDALNPTLILFVTGPGYDRYLADEFPGLKFGKSLNYPERTLAELKSPTLKAPAYRTYHPGYLNRKIGFGPLQTALEEIMTKLP